MTWFSEENMDVSFVLPNYEDDEAISDSVLDSEIHRVDLGQQVAEIKEIDPNKTTQQTKSNGNDSISDTKNKTKNAVKSGTKNQANLNEYKWHVCGVAASTRFNLKRHISRYHKKEDVAKAQDGNCICLECGYRCRYITDLRKHLHKQHLKVFRTERITFDDNSAFQTWKDDTETSNHCSFVILSGKVKNKQNEAQQYYQCNRCGQYKPNRKGKRRVKMSGTCKI
ncbi:uncharacterized protein LOC130629197 isoform X2 [Hydractinia symbiolongicarpus]|uniref:uncharacterized protein LOC130629197 isoform X2 n=1 Tax=Hydractinia symbiolongicarpus TaxID=13093 RepID=UPI00254C4B73|nr:uncharacterized protein LOC130629197 isoform X2 [Hydractinia symbiolongicarpus]